MKKFELTSEFITNAFGVKLFRIRALVEFGDVKAGDLGGYIEKEENLDQDGNAWVSGNARVSGNAWVSGDARVSGNAWVSGNADYATVKGFGRYNRNTTFFRCKDEKVRVACGCFFGDMEEFRAIVKKTHGDGKLAKEYLAIADLMEMHFAKENEDDTARNPQQV